MIGSRSILFLHLPLPSFVTFTTGHEMTEQRKKINLDTEPVVDEVKIHALRQYNDTDGHFSLVRFVYGTPASRGLGSSLTGVGFEQEFPSRRPRNDHEWRLRCIFHLLFGQVSRDKDPNHRWTALWLPLQVACLICLTERLRGGERRAVCWVRSWTVLQTWYVYHFSMSSSTHRFAL